MRTDKNSLLEGYENTRLVTFDDIDENFPNAVYYDELPQTEVNGVLKANLHRGGRLLQVYSGQDCHTGVVAATRLGKTSSYAIPNIISFARQKVKKSMIISDAKGELFNGLAPTLRAEGYDVKFLNFRNWQHSETWNPLSPIYRDYQRAYNVEKEVQTVWIDCEKYVFQGKTYTSKRELDRDVKRYKELLMTDVGNAIDDMGEIIMPTVNTKDPYWEDSARGLLKAYLWAMLEDSHPTQPSINPITEDTYSFSTIIDLMMIAEDDDFGGNYFSRRGKKSKAYSLAKNILLENATNTRNCIVSTFNSKISIFKDSIVRLITCCNSFEMSDLTGERPVAIFIGYKDELRTHYKIISLFIQCAYTYLIDYTRKKDNGRLDRAFYFILDEFGNFPAIKDFDTTISACGGRNIWFMLILQSYAQLYNVYGAETANIILDNLNMRLFMGSNNQETLNKFSEECGKVTRYSPASALNGSGKEIDNYQIETISLVPVSRLSHFSVGECIIKEANCGYVMFTMLERYFTCDEFKNLPRCTERSYECRLSPLDEKYRYVYRRVRPVDL